MSEFTFRLLSLIIVIQFNCIISIDEIDVHHSNLRRWIKWKPPHSIHKETKVLESYFDVIIKRILWNPIPTGCSQWRFHSDVLAKGTAGFFWTCSKEEEIVRFTTGTVYGSVRLEIIDVSLEYASNRDYVRFEFDIKKIFQEKDIIFIIGMSCLKKKQFSHLKFGLRPFFVPELFQFFVLFWPYSKYSNSYCFILFSGKTRQLMNKMISSNWYIMEVMKIVLKTRETLKKALIL